MKFSIKDFFSKYDQICSFLRIWSHLFENSLMENVHFLCSINSIVLLIELIDQLVFVRD